MFNRVSVSPAVAFGVAAFGIASFSLMDVLMKTLSIHIGAYNAVLWRNVIGAMIAGALFISARHRWPSPTNIRLHLKRSIIVAMMAVSFFWSLIHLPLAEAIGLSFISPVIALYLARILLGEHIGKAAIIASAAGLCGVGIIVFGKFKGNYSSDMLWGVAAVLFSAVVYAYNLILARQQAQKAGPVEITFFQNLLTAVVLSLFAPWFVEPVALAWYPLLIGAALLAIISLLLLSWAYARAEAQILIPVEYTGFVWAVIFGWIFFSEAVTIETLIGTILIITGSLVAARAKPQIIQHTEQVSA
jgi:S-adenosylmethionine uptake transporter